MDQINNQKITKSKKTRVDIKLFVNTSNESRYDMASALIDLASSSNLIKKDTIRFQK